MRQIPERKRSEEICLNFIKADLKTKQRELKSFLFTAVSIRKSPAANRLQTFTFHRHIASLIDSLQTMSHEKIQCLTKNEKLTPNLENDVTDCKLQTPFRDTDRQHYTDVITCANASQITSLTIVYSTVYSGADQRKHQSSASLAFVRGIHRGPVKSPHKWPVTRKMFPFDDVNMKRATLLRH